MERYFDLIGEGKEEEAELLREKDIPDKLIKFIWLNNDDTDEQKMNSLRNNQIWISSTMVLNDPFEFKGMFLNRDAFRKCHYPEEVIDKYESLLDLSKYGVCSLSANEISYLPMWAYYTNGYKGFCIEYKLMHKKGVYQVLYEPKRIPIASLIFQFKEKMDALQRRECSKGECETLGLKMMRNLYIKSNTWKHEKEYRIVQFIDRKKGENFDISSLGLKVERIIAGINCSEENRNKLNEISNEIGCGNAYDSYLNERDYFLDIKRMKNIL